MASTGRLERDAAAQAVGEARTDHFRRHEKGAFPSARVFLEESLPAVPGIARR
jgi:hypothetical protein